MIWIFQSSYWLSFKSAISFFDGSWCSCSSSFVTIFWGMCLWSGPTSSSWEGTKSKSLWRNTPLTRNFLQVRGFGTEATLKVIQWMFSSFCNITGELNLLRNITESEFWSLLFIFKFPNIHSSPSRLTGAISLLAMFCEYFCGEWKNLLCVFCSPFIPLI